MTKQEILVKILENIRKSIDIIAIISVLMLIIVQMYTKKRSESKKNYLLLAGIALTILIINVGIEILAKNIH